MRTQGEIEAAISEGVIRFEQDYMGRDEDTVAFRDAQEFRPTEPKRKD